MREWLVAGGLLVGPEGLLLVQNRRRNGSFDWTTPGGVIDPGETLLAGLSREVVEETGLTVSSWESLAYRVEVDFVDQEMTLQVESHIAESWSGDLTLDDPDAIVVDATFLPTDEAIARLEPGPRWVSEPLTTWLESSVAGQTFRYVASGRASELRVERR